MRKIFAACAVVLFAAITTHAASIANYGVTDANYVWRLDTAVSSSASYDSIIGNATPADSILVKSNYSPKQGWETVLIRDTLTCAHTDSLTAQIVIKCKDQTGNVIYETYPDTLSGAAGEAYELDFGGAAIGAKYDILFRAIAGTERANQIIFNRMYLYNRRVITTSDRNW